MALTIMVCHISDLNGKNFALRRRIPGITLMYLKKDELCLILSMPLLSLS